MGDSFRICSYTWRPYQPAKRGSMNRPTRKQIQEALKTVPIDQVLSVPGQLTHKQKTFARLVAEGNTGADAYRKAYNAKGKPKTVGNTASELKKHPGISREIEAYQAAIEAAKYRTPAHLRELVIHSLVKIAIDEDVKAATRVQAAKVLGTVTEVAAFTERKEVTHIKTSEDARAAVLAKLRDIMKGNAQDVDSKDADSLLLEIMPAASHDDAMTIDAATDDANAASDAPPAEDFPSAIDATPTPTNDVRSPGQPIHTNPHTQSPKFQESTPPVSDSVASLEAELSGNTPRK